jgi:hypothetical protein
MHSLVAQFLPRTVHAVELHLPTALARVACGYVASLARSCASVAAAGEFESCLCKLTLAQKYERLVGASRGGHVAMVRYLMAKIRRSVGDAMREATRNKKPQREHHLENQCCHFVNLALREPCRAEVARILVLEGIGKLQVSLRAAGRGLGWWLLPKGAGSVRGIVHFFSAPRTLNEENALYNACRGSRVGLVQFLVASGAMDWRDLAHSEQYFNAPLMRNT